MQARVTRRGFTIGLGLMSALVGPALAAPRRPAGNPFEALERAHGGRLGVFLLDTHSGRSLSWRADERFLMCSTFKVFAAAAVLARVDAGREQLDRRLPFGRAQLLDYAPAAEAAVGRGFLTVEEACQASVELSDNTAANLLIDNIGGPGALTLYWRGLGDTVSRLDRDEPGLNLPYGVYDTTSPRAFAGSLRTLLLGRSLSAASRARLEGWMRASSTGRRRLRAGLPTTWVAGDKTGSGQGQTNDVAVIRPPGRAPLFAAAFYASTAEAPAREAVLAEVGRRAAAWLL